jgi:hypothetical protein
MEEIPKIRHEHNHNESQSEKEGQKQQLLSQKTQILDFMRALEGFEIAAADSPTVEVSRKLLVVYGTMHQASASAIQEISKLLEELG